MAAIQNHRFRHLLNHPHPAFHHTDHPVSISSNLDGLVNGLLRTSVQLAGHIIADHTDLLSGGNI